MGRWWDRSPGCQTRQPCHGLSTLPSLCRKQLALVTEHADCSFPRGTWTSRPRHPKPRPVALPRVGSTVPADGAGSRTVPSGSAAGGSLAARERVGGNEGGVSRQRSRPELHSGGRPRRGHRQPPLRLARRRHPGHAVDASPARRKDFDELPALRHSGTARVLHLRRRLRRLARCRDES
jgi:hypothetical protein